MKFTKFGRMEHLFTYEKTAAKMFPAASAQNYVSHKQGELDFSFSDVLSAGKVEECSSHKKMEYEIRELIRSYEAVEDATLIYGSYLDLLQNKWACLVQGKDWVELCFLERTEDGGSQMKKIYLDVDTWEQNYAHSRM